MLRQALDLAEADDCYQALKLARRVMRHEEEVLGLPPLPPPGWRSRCRRHPARGAHRPPGRADMAAAR